MNNKNKENDTSSMKSELKNFLKTKLNPDDSFSSSIDELSSFQFKLIDDSLNNK